MKYLNAIIGALIIIGMFFLGGIIGQVLFL